MLFVGEICVFGDGLSQVGVRCTPTVSWLVAKGSLGLGLGGIVCCYVCMGQRILYRTLLNISLIHTHVCTYVCMYVQSTLPVQIGTTGSLYRKLLYHFDCFV